MEKTLFTSVVTFRGVLTMLLLATPQHVVCGGSDQQHVAGESNRLSSRVVMTKYGSLRGFINTLSNRHLQPVEVFLGVPYAGVPIGSLRFLPPVTPPHWRGVRTADHFGPVCSQRLPDTSNDTDALRRMPAGRLDYLRRLVPFLKNQSEDCLYLNIYTPSGGSPSAKFPVMVFIHGESYDWNSGNPYDGSALASAGNVIVVTINYRLGIFGFMPALDASSRGNYGLMDQVAALHWVQENIAEFGGDPKSVTVFGHGYGAACINLLMLSPLAKGLFQRAIMQSGSALSPWAIARDALAYTRQMAFLLKCPTEANDALVECLRQRPVNEILNVHLHVPDHLTAFGPTIDGVVIPNEPAILMEKQTELFSQYDLLLGMTRIEAYFHFSANEDRVGIDVQRRDRLLRTLIRNLFVYHLQEIFLTVVNEYTDWSKPDQHPINVLDATADAMGDALVVAPLIRTGNFHSRVPPRTYLYVFTYQSEEGLYTQRMGCVHGEDLPYVFGAPLVNSLAHFPRNYTRQEGALSEAVITYWTNFAKYGDPNTAADEEGRSGSGRGRFERIIWPTYDNVHQKYLAIGMKPRVRDHYHAHRLSFWLNLIPTLHRSAATETTARHHLLEDHDNPLTYDGVFRQMVKGDSLPPVTPAPFSPSVTTHLSSQGNASEPSTVAAPMEGATVASPSNITDSLAMIMQQGAYSTALSVTIAIGCSLLILNVLIFAGVYYQKDKNKSESLQKRDFQIRPEMSCPSSQSKQLPMMKAMTSPLDLPPPAFMSMPPLNEAGTLPSKIPPQDPGLGMPEAQPLLAPTGRPAPHWPATQEMRVHFRETREETTV